VFHTGVTNGRAFAICACGGVAWADPPSRLPGGKFGRAEFLSGAEARAATEIEIDKYGWFLEIEGTVPESMMAAETVLREGDDRYAAGAGTREVPSCPVRLARTLSSRKSRTFRPCARSDSVSTSWNCLFSASILSASAM